MNHTPVSRMHKCDDSKTSWLALTCPRRIALSQAMRLPARVHFATEPPDLAIMNCVEQHAIDLLVLGTVGRTGIAAFMTGNTAEQVLDRATCSVLTIKPNDFISSVTLPDG